MTPFTFEDKSAGFNTKLSRPNSALKRISEFRLQDTPQNRALITETYNKSRRGDDFSDQKRQLEFEISDIDQSCDLEASIIHKIKMNKVIQNFETKNFTKN